MAGSSAGSSGLQRIIILFAACIVALLVLGIVATLLLIKSSDETVDTIGDFVTTLATESTDVTNAYLDIAESAGRVTERSLADSDRTLDSPLLIATLQNVVAANESINGAFVGFPSGDFLYATKSLASTEDGLRIKRIENSASGGREVTERQTASDSTTLDERVLPDDTFDPRGRPWYQDAGSQGRGWTAPYVFASSRLPGITHYIAVHDDAGELKGIVGVDVRLTQLRSFLGDRQPSDGGHAVIVADDGSIIAAGSDDGQIGAPLEQFAAMTTADMTAPITTEWVDRESAEVAASHVAALTRIGGDQQWTLVITAPEQDFLSGVGLTVDKFRTFLPVLGAIVIFGVLAAATSSSQRIARLQRHAISDPLTGVLNRSEARNRLAEMLDSAPTDRIAALTIDLTDLTDINDTWGHEAGDAVLLSFSERLVAALPPSGFVGRFGGVEFLAVVPVDVATDVERAMKDLLAVTVADQVVIDQAKIDLHLSCGYCLREPGEVIDEKTLLRNADLALLTAKANKTLIVQFDPEMTMPSLRDAERLDELVAAVEGREFEYYFQHEVNIGTGEIVGAEALLRWIKADGSIVAAEQFITDLERLGVIDLLTPLMLEQSQALVDAVGSMPFTMRVNLCAEQLRNIETLHAIAAVEQDSSARWCIEITERTIVDCDVDTLRMLERLVEEGIELALDDFGTGYSSFAELASLPVTTIKIDRSFVRQLSNEAVRSSLASVIYDMADRLSLDVVAEGIETEDQRLALVRIGCTHGQGYLFGRPMPADRFLATTTSGTLVSES